MSGLQEIRDRIRAAEAATGRDAGSVRLVAVSKVQPPARIEAVLAQGHRVFGENKVQEAAGRWPDYRDRHPGIELHLIGPLQTNKARAAIELFDWIETIDRPKLARTLARLADEIGSCPKLLVQVNTGAEPQKAGVLPDDLDDLLGLCRELDLPVRGLMCIPPLEADPVPHFEQLAELAGRHGLDELSMGMSADFEQAIACGATIVRVGSAIFGERD